MILRLKPLLPPLFEPYDHELRAQIYTTAKKYNIRIYDLILNHTHMHALVLLPNRESYNGFIRELTSRMTQHFSFKLKFLGAKLKKIFTHHPFTRLVQWGKAFKKLKDYMKKNEAESGVAQRTWNLQFGMAARHDFGMAARHDFGMATMYDFGIALRHDSKSAQLIFSGLEPS